MKNPLKVAGTLAVLGVAGLGCHAAGPAPANLKPPFVEQYTLPPEGDARWREPHRYPDETLNKTPKRPNVNTEMPDLPAPTRNGGGGPGGMGGPMGGR